MGAVQHYIYKQIYRDDLNCIMDLLFITKETMETSTGITKITPEILASSIKNLGTDDYPEEDIKIPISDKMAIELSSLINNEKPFDNEVKKILGLNNTKQ